MNNDVFAFEQDTLYQFTLSTGEKLKGYVVGVFSNGIQVNYTRIPQAHIVYWFELEE